MAFTKDFSIDRVDFATAFGQTSTGRGVVVNGFQTEFVKVKKSTGDTTGSFDLTAIRRPSLIYCIPLTNSSAAILTAEPTVVAVAFTNTDNDTVAVSGLGDWTAAYLIVCGRSYTY